MAPTIGSRPPDSRNASEEKLIIVSLLFSRMQHRASSFGPFDVKIGFAGGLLFGIVAQGQVEPHVAQSDAG